MPVALAPRARKISAIPPTASRPRIWYLFAVEPTSAATFATPGIVGPHCLGCQTRREEGSTVWWGGVLRRRLGECRIWLHFEVSSGARVGPAPTGRRALVRRARARRPLRLSGGRLGGHGRRARRRRARCGQRLPWVEMQALRYDVVHVGRHGTGASKRTRSRA